MESRRGDWRDHERVPAEWEAAEDSPTQLGPDQLGRWTSQTVVRLSPHGAFLGDPENAVLLPKNESSGLQVGNSVDVFFYRDSEDRPIFTRTAPRAIVGEAGWMTIVGVSDTGAFADWGLPKNLLVPHRVQSRPLREGERVMVAVYVDERSERLCGTTMVDRVLTTPAPYVGNEMVSAVPYRQLDNGYAVVIERKFLGVTQNYPRLELGRPLKGYIGSTRDGRVSLVPRPTGTAGYEDGIEVLRMLMQKNNGWIGVTDTDSPDEIRRKTGLSKAAFKRAVGGMLKAGLIDLETHGIRWRN